MRHFNYAMVALGGLALLASLPTAARAGYFQQTNLVTNNPSVTPAPTTDPNLVNPWGISFGTNSPFWVSDQGTQVSTLYNAPDATKNPLVVSILPSGTGVGPTGQVNNNTTGFIIPSDGTPAAFIFANLNGSISAWNPGLGAVTPVTAQVVVQPVTGASFTGLALATNGSLYAADKGTGTIDVYNSSFVRSGSFTDTSLPGFTPYNIQSLSDGRLYVTFQNTSNAMAGAVAIFNPITNTFQTLIPSTDSHLKEPWGLALAPSAFGPFGGDLLVGNKMNGEINAYNPMTGAFVGTLTDANGNPIADPGLWGLAFRAASSGFDPNALYFAAGVGFQGGDIYADGLFGSISFVPEPASAILLGLGMIVLCGVCHWGSRRSQRGSAPGKEEAIHVP